MSATQQSDRTDRSIQSDAAATPVPAPAPGPAPQRFRAPTVEEALRQARELLGDDAEIIEASRIRRGGIGGFFATELGVEVLAQSAASMVAQPGHPAGDSEHADLHAALTRAAGAPVTDLGRTPARGRAAWEAASHDLALPVARTAAAATSPAVPPATRPAAPVLRGSHVEPPTATLFEALVQRVAAEERAAASTSASTSASRPDTTTDAGAPAAPLPHRTPKMFRAWRANDHQHDATIPRLSMFDESATADAADAAATALEGDQSVAAPDVTFVESRATDVAGAGIEAGDTADASSTFAAHFLRELMRDAEALRTDPERKPAKRRPSRADAPTLPGIADAAATADLADIAPTDTAAATDTPDNALEAPPAPKRARAKRAPRPRPVTAGPIAEPELPFARVAPIAETVTPETVTPETVTSESVTPEIVADPSVAITSIVDQCVRLASEAGGPSKVALAMTMGDGQVVKITVEMPRGAR